MATIISAANGNASSPATWVGGVVPGPTDHWQIQHHVTIDSGMPVDGNGNVAVDSGGIVEILSVAAGSGSCILEIAAGGICLCFYAGAELITDHHTTGDSTPQLWIDDYSSLAVLGGTFTVTNDIDLDVSSYAQVAVGMGATLTNFPSFHCNVLMVTDLSFDIAGDFGQGGTTSVALNYTGFGIPTTVTFEPPVELLADSASGAQVDFVVRDSSGDLADSYALPQIAVSQNGEAAAVTVTLTHNVPGGSYTATFATPTPGETYYLPLIWTILNGSTIDYYVQEFRVFVLATVYTAKLDYTQAAAEGSDLYVISWYRDDNPASNASACQIEVIRAADGSTLIPATAMTQVGATDTWSYTESVNLMTDGAPLIVIATATIDGSARTRYIPIGRDD